MSIFISASLLNDFISCNRKVYYRLIKPEQSIPSREMIMGEIVHAGIEKFLMDKESSLAYMYKEVMDRIPNDKSALISVAEYNNVYHSYFKPLLLPEDNIEMKFKIPYDKDTFVVGKIDRISNGNVFDWKTDRTPQTNVSNNIQFILYNWAYRKIYNHQPSGVYYAALANGKLVKFNFNSKIEGVVLNEIIPSVIKAIKNKEYIRNGILRKACFRCVYSDTCLEEFNHELDSSTSTTK